MEGQGSHPDPDKTRTHRLRFRQRLVQPSGASRPVDRHPRQRRKPRVRQHKGAAVVRLEIVNLFAEDERPEVLAEELYHVQRRVRTW